MRPEEERPHAEEEPGARPWVHRVTPCPCRAVMSVPCPQEMGLSCPLPLGGLSRGSLGLVQGHCFATGQSGSSGLLARGRQWEDNKASSGLRAAGRGAPHAWEGEAEPGSGWGARLHLAPVVEGGIRRLCHSSGSTVCAWDQSPRKLALADEALRLGVKSCAVSSEGSCPPRPVKAS